MSETTFEIVKIVASVIATIIGLYLIPYIRRKTVDAEYKELCEAVSVGVRAVEQTIKESGMGKVKKAQVIAYVTAWLNGKNINISEEQLDKLIECTVYYMKQEQK